MTDLPGPDGPAAPLTGLLEVVHDLGAGSDLDHVLRRVVEVACEISGARYGALGVIDEVDPTQLFRFITHGLTEEERAAIGDLPRGKGLLGRLIRDPSPVRLADLTQAPDAVGFPPGHPPMRTFLGMPVRVGDRVFGNLYLTEKADGAAFSAHDEELVQALAAVAGAVVDSVQQRSATRLQSAVVDGIWEVHRNLLADVDLEDALPLIAERVRELSAAAAVAVVAVDDDGTRRVLAASGTDTATELAAIAEQVTAALGGSAPVHLDGADRPTGPDTAAARTRTTLLPVSPRSDAPTLLVVSGWRPRAGLGEARVVDLLQAFAVQIALVLDQAQRDDDRHLLALLEDRDRIARDLHDLVIQRLFAVGLQLQGASRLVVRPEVLDRLQSAVAELDATIRDIRATIFELQHRPGQSSLRADLRQLVDSYAATLGFSPVVQFHGPIDSALDDELQIHLLAVLREALSNVARHAQAVSTLVEVRIEDSTVVARIVDDGVGIPAEVTESGVRNIRSRALARGGTVRLAAREPHGTEVTWRVPLGR